MPRADDRWVRPLSICFGLLFCWTGVAKAVGPGELARYMGILEPFADWPRVARVALVGVVPALEIALGGSLLLRARARSAAWCGAGFVLLATLLVWPQQDGLPQCPCLALPASLALPGWAFLLRNGLIVAGLAAIALASRSPRGYAPRSLKSVTV